MLYLATGHATAKEYGDGIVLSIPNGDGSVVEISLTVHQAFMAHRRLREAACEKLDSQQDFQVAEVLQLQKRRVEA